MPLLDLSSPAVQRFLIENYTKENRLRVNWNNKNKERIQQAATLQREPTNYFPDDVTGHVMLEGLKAISRDHISSAVNRMVRAKKPFIPGVKHLRHGNSIVDIGLGDPKLDPRLTRPDTDLTSDPVMRPVDPKVRDVIYQSPPEFGREKYLKMRFKVSPEEKFYFDQTSSWMYGWRMGDSKSRMYERYGKACPLTLGTARSRVGPQPDPDHYKSSDAPTGPTSCVQ